MTGFVLVSESVNGGIQALAGILLICRLLTRELPEKRRIGAGFLGGVLISLCLSLAGLYSFYRIGLKTVWIVLCCGGIKQGKGRMSFFVGIYYEIAAAFWQFLAASALGILFHSQAFLEWETVQGQTAFSFVSLICLGLSVYIWKRQDMTGREGFRFASGISLGGFIAVITLSQQKRLEIPADTLSMWTILSVVLLMSVLVFNLNSQYEMERELAELKSRQAELLERDYATLNNSYAVNAKLFHDFHNHIGVLRQLLLGEKYREAVLYLEELQEPMREITDRVWTGDGTADYLINSKGALAGERGIDFSVQGEFPRHTDIRSVDLCAILGNLLDNAIEAAGKVKPPEQSFVSLTIRRINQMLVIKVENSFAISPVQREGELKTTKGEEGLHGWGLKSAKAAAEKYDGVIQYSHSGKRFQVVATLSYQGVEKEC